MNYQLLHSLAEVTASYTSQDTDRERPLLSATIPINLDEGVDDTERGGYRVQVVMPSAVEEKTIALCIRKPTLLDFGLGDYSAQGAFEDVNRKLDDEQYSDDRLAALHKAGELEEFLRGAVRSHKNIGISAGTNAGSAVQVQLATPRAVAAPGRLAGTAATQQAPAPAQWVTFLDAPQSDAPGSAAQDVQVQRARPSAIAAPVAAHARTSFF